MTLIGIATLGAGNTVEAASINSGIADYSISAEISIDNIEGIDTKCIDTIEAATIETNAITDNIGGKAINDGIYTEIVDNTIGEGIPVEGIAKTIPTNILKNNSINITIEKEDIAY
jgi:hypothetical protein